MKNLHNIKSNIDIPNWAKLIAIWFSKKENKPVLWYSKTKKLYYEENGKIYPAAKDSIFASVSKGYKLSEFKPSMVEVING